MFGKMIMEQYSTILHALQQPAAYSHPVKNTKTIITAVSAVFLTGEYAYKINKPLNLGFLDFSTLEKRKDQCEKEVKYNSLISPELYLGTVRITKNTNGAITVNGDGKIIEYGIKMKQVDPDATMNNLLAKNLITMKHIQELAKKIFQFHHIAPTSQEISGFGRIDMIQFNWNENFEQTEKYKPAIVSQVDFEFMQQKINKFIQQNKELFEKRIAKNKIKHCHGDFHSSNVFVTNDATYIFDGIVFNQRFPCSDIIAEIAFMAMDLDFHNKQELSELFIKEYQRLSDDEDIPTLLNFYKCYRAYIRAKINCFTYDDQNLNDDEKRNANEKAQQYFTLARDYADLL